ncbi:metallopeptidase family protein [Chloroflexota bacterium]
MLLCFKSDSGGEKKAAMARKGILSNKEFESLVAKTLASIPEEFHDLVENVAVMIEDEPPGDMSDVMGLYEGVPLVERSIGDSLLPDCITLYKGLIERTCRTPAEIEAEVRLTVLHEVGHFFGLEESQLEQL